MNAETMRVPPKIFEWIVDHPKRVVALSLLLIVTFALFVPSLTKDTRADAFLAEDNPALVYREKVKMLFGLSDPIVVAVVDENGIFTPSALNSISRVTDIIYDIENVDPDRITSLAMENNIVGTEEGMEVDPFFEEDISSQEESDRIKNAIRNFPLYQGSLVANDETASLIVAELIDEDLSEETYHDIVTALTSETWPEGIKIHIAGEGAVSGYLGVYIDSDAQRLNPIAGIIITIILFIAFLRFSATLMANVIIAASALITIGVMAMLGIPFYVITNALPVILIGIAVADSIHIYSEYFERRALFPEESFRASILSTMGNMWRPVTLTTFTTIAGFLGLYFAAYMPPFKYFGLFAAVGVAVAWIYSMVFLPAVMSLLKTEVNPRLKTHISAGKHDVFARFMIGLGHFTRRYTKVVIGFAVVVAVIGLFAASRLSVNEDRIETFHPSEELYIADKEINKRFDGTNYLDIVVETPDNEGLFDPEVLRKMEALQQYAESFPYVMGSTSIVDYLKQMNRALNGGDVEQYVLPSDRDLIAQYFLLYTASSDPTDFEEEVDYDYRMANVRVNMTSGAYVHSKAVIESLESYINTQFNNDSVKATLSGRVSLNYHWINDLGVSHFMGMGLALFLVWMVSSFLFRSVIAGTFALMPVGTSILIVYSSMVVFNIPLGIGTSMFAAVAIGLGVDFAIHTIDRLRALFQETQDIDETMSQFYPSTGRALLFNLLAIALGFGVLVTSKVVPLNNFGLIVAVSVVTSFIVSLTLIPALVIQFKPSFVTLKKSPAIPHGAFSDGAKSALMVVVAVLGLSLFIGEDATAEELPEGRWIMENVNALDEGEFVTRKLQMRMVDKRGKERVRQTLGYRKYYGEEKRTVLYYLSPRNVKDTGFLTFDYPGVEKDDDQWLYLPALRKARRISASDRGDYFLGTDFSYEDIKKEGKVELNDYQFSTLGRETLDGVDTFHIEAVPVTETIAKELGYGKVHSWVDANRWIVIRAKYWDTKQNELKTLRVGDIRKVDNILTRHKLEITNHKTGHFTEFIFSDVDYTSPVSDRVFTRQALTRGAP